MIRHLLGYALPLLLLVMFVGCGDSGDEKGTAPMPKSGPVGTSPGDTPPTAPAMKN